MLWLLLIPYCTAVYGIHGGEGITGLNRQFRNLICALPFALVAYVVTSTHYDYPIAAAAFTLAYIGTSMGFTKYPLWLKGLVTLPPLGALLLPLAYANKNWMPATCEYLSGALYGLALFIIVIVAK